MPTASSLTSTYFENSFVCQCTDQHTVAIALTTEQNKKRKTQYILLSKRRSVSMTEIFTSSFRDIQANGTHLRSVCECTKSDERAVAH